MNRFQTTFKAAAFLDQIAIGMAVLCGIHCLLMPVLIALIPIIATGIFVHQDFHLWMLLLVLPTTGLSLFMGCRKHKDRWTAALAAVGIGSMIAVTVFETTQHHAQTDTQPTCSGCARSVEQPIPLSAWLNTLGGLLVASAHVRNFKLCRKTNCSH